MFTSIVQVEALAFEQMAHRLTWGQYVNWNGGQGKNVACDMAQEICSRVSKDVVKGMGTNKTEKAMIRASKTAAGVFQIVRAMNGSLQIHDVSNTHSKKSLCEDEMLLLDDLRKLKPFKRTPGREHNHFPGINVSATSTVNVSNLFAWLQKYNKQIGMEMSA